MAFILKCKYSGAVVATPSRSYGALVGIGRFVTEEQDKAFRWPTREAVEAEVEGCAHTYEILEVP